MSAPEVAVAVADDLKQCGQKRKLNTKSDEVWKIRLKELRQYKLDHGDCNVPAVYPMNRKLGHWVMTQRRQYVLMKEDKRSTLSVDRVAQLDDIGFSWTIRSTKGFSWADRFEELVKFKKEFGHCLVPQRFPQNPALGSWVNTQRRFYQLFRQGKAASITHERIRALEELGFKWRCPTKKARKDPATTTSVDFTESNECQETTQALTVVDSSTEITPQLQQHVHDPTWQVLGQNRMNSLNLAPAICSETDPLKLLHFLLSSQHGRRIQEDAFASQQLSWWSCQICGLKFVGSNIDANAHEAHCRQRANNLQSSFHTCT